MGHVNTKITLKNLDDTKQARKGNLPEHKIRQATIDVMVDTGATMLVINEQLSQQLGLDAIGEREISFANDATNLRFAENCKVTEPLEINWKDRSITLPALVVKDAPEFLLGVMPLEGMDLMVDTVNERLVGAHGDHFVYRVK
jgi:predicted aspartyl protease